jgi:hypothetical protein
MKQDCPHCGRSIGWRLVKSAPLPDQRRLFPMQALPACPLCGGLLAACTHWSEHAFGTVVGVAIAVPFLFGQLVGKLAVLWWCGISLVVMAALVACFHVRYWRHLQRYKAYEPPQTAR